VLLSVGIIRRDISSFHITDIKNDRQDIPTGNIRDFFGVVFVDEVGAIRDHFHRFSYGFHGTETYDPCL
jgi:hypothetical protein